MAPFSLKGKGKARDDEEDLNPVITYRHILTNNAGVLDPLRVVVLCDMDAFYASAEQVRLGLDPEVPLAVQQWQGLIAVNYPARKFGISRMETVTDAKKKCPELVLVHVATFKEGESVAGYFENPSPDTHKVSLDHYRRESLRIMALHQSNLPEGGELERASIDEAFFDLTVPVKKIMVDRYHFLSQCPSDSPNGMDTPLPPPPSISWGGIGNLIPTEPTEDQSELREENLTTESQHVEPSTWHDVALSIGAELIMRMRVDVKEKLGYTTSAGIARNKFLAKLVASYRKRDQQSILRNAAIPNYLRPMPFQKIRFLGGKLGFALADELGAKTVGDILNVSLDEMQRKFGDESIWVWNILRGVDHTEVKEKSSIKSMLASKNVRPAITKAAEATHWLKILSVELSLRLNEGREQAPSLWPKTIALHIKQGNEAPRSKQLPFPFSRKVTPELVLRSGEKLWKELTAGGSPSYKIHNLALSFSGLGSLESGQQGIEGFFAKPDSESTSDSLARVKRKRNEPNEIIELDDDGEVLFIPSPPVYFECDRCRKRITGSTGSSKDDRSITLERLKMEHEDFHFAEQLSRQREDEEEGSSGGRSHRSPIKKKKKKDIKGIAKYFEPRSKA